MYSLIYLYTCKGIKCDITQNAYVYISICYYTAPYSIHHLLTYTILTLLYRTILLYYTTLYIHYTTYRDVLKSDSSMVYIPELDLELTHGTLGTILLLLTSLLYIFIYYSMLYIIEYYHILYTYVTNFIYIYSLT